MRTHFFISMDDPKQLEQLKGCKYVEDRLDGNGPELIFEDAIIPDDYPEKFALVRNLPDTRYYQIMPLSNNPSVGEKLLKFCQDNADKVKLAIYANAKELAIAEPAVADACLYERQAILDSKGKPTGETVKRPGAELRLACCLVGDNSVLCADPSKVVPDENPIVGLGGKL